MPLTKAEARLEALKLAVRPGLERAAIIETANAYYDFVTQDNASWPTSAEANEGVTDEDLKPKARKK